jgi:hypothetical protein
MGRNIGELGTRRAPLDLDFTYFGATIRLHPQASDTVELEFLEVGKGIDLEALRGADLAELDEAEASQTLSALGRAMMQAHRLIKDSLRQVIHPEDFDTYWKLARDNGQQIRDLMADLKRITASVVEAETGFPTTPPSASQPGPEATPARSADGSSSEVEAALSDPRMALRLLRGRPDLQEFVVEAQEAHQAKAQQAAQASGAPRTAAEKLLAAGGH